MVGTLSAGYSMPGGRACQSARVVTAVTPAHPEGLQLKMLLSNAVAPARPKKLCLTRQ